MNKKITAVLLVSIFLTSFGAVLAADGDIIWEKIGPVGYGYGVATDSYNNVIVTGNGGTVKYSPNGNVLWFNVSLVGNGIAVDSKGNIIITGTAGTTMKYDTNGNQLWPSAIAFGGRGVAVDSNNNIIVTGDSNIQKYDTNGNQLWPSAIAFGGTARDVAVDSKNNVIVVGTSSNNYFINKYDPNGNSLWNKNIDINPSQTDQGYGVAVDSFDNIIFTGWVYDFLDPSIQYASCTIKFTSTGAEIWRIYDNTGDRWSYKVAVDSYNNIILTGGKKDPSLYYQYLTVKYDSNGKKIWEKAVDYSNGYDDSYDVAVDSQNNIVVTGYVYNGSNYDYYTIKYQGTPPRSKSPLPIAKILEILKGNQNKE